MRASHKIKNTLVCLTRTSWRFCTWNLSCQPVLCLAESYEELYCFSYKPNVDEEERRHEWDFLDLKADYSRMGLPNSLWKRSPVNQHYKVSEPISVATCSVLSLYGNGSSSDICYVVFKGEWHLPRWPVCTRVRHTSGHSGELQVQKQREVSYSVVLLQRKSCKLTAYMYFPHASSNNSFQGMWSIGHGIVATLTQPVSLTQALHRNGMKLVSGKQKNVDKRSSIKM